MDGELLLFNKGLLLMYSDRSQGKILLRWIFLDNDILRGHLAAGTEIPREVERAR